MYKNPKWSNNNPYKAYRHIKGTLKPELKFPIQNTDELNTIIEPLLEKKRKLW